MAVVAGVVVRMTVVMSMVVGVTVVIVGVVVMIVPVIVVMVFVPVVLVVMGVAGLAGRLPQRHGAEGDQRQQGNAAPQHGVVEERRQDVLQHFLMVHQEADRPEGAAEEDRAEL